MKILLPTITALVLFIFMTAFFGTVYALPNIADQFMPKCIFLAAINQLDMTKDQLQAMLNLTTKIDKDREEHRAQHQALLEPIYQKLVQGQGVTLDQIKEQMGQPPKPDITKREEMRKEVEQLWAMLNPKQQETLRNMPLPHPGHKHMDKSEGHGTKGQPEGMEGFGPPEGPPQDMPFGGAGFEGRIDGNQPESMNAPSVHLAAQTTTANDDQPSKGKGNKGPKMDKGIMNMMHLVMMPGAAEALQDRINDMK